MKIQSSKRALRARNRRVIAETEVSEEVSGLLFEAEDVAELMSDVSGEDVEVTVDGDVVEFAVGEEVYTCEAEPTDETVESSTRMRRGKRRVSASATRRPAGRAVRRVSHRR